jgi:hypothetical protein
MNLPSASWVSFEPHQTLLDDRNVQDKIEQFLKRCWIDSVNFNSTSLSFQAQAKTGATVEEVVQRMSARIVLEPDVGVTPARSFSVEATLRTGSVEEIDPPGAFLIAKLNGREFARREMQLTESGLDGQDLRFAYSSKGLAAPAAGVVEVEVTFANSVSTKDQAIAPD